MSGKLFLPGKCCREGRLRVQLRAGNRWRQSGSNIGKRRISLSLQRQRHGVPVSQSLRSIAKGASHSVREPPAKPCKTLGRGVRHVSGTHRGLASPQMALRRSSRLSMKHCRLVMPKHDHVLQHKHCLSYERTPWMYRRVGRRLRESYETKKL